MRRHGSRRGGKVIAALPRDKQVDVLTRPVKDAVSFHGIIAS